LTATLMVTSAVWLLAKEAGLPSLTKGFMTAYPVPTTNGAPQNIVVETAG